MTGLLEALRPVLALILGVVLELFLQRADPTAEDARRQPELRERLRAKVRERWGKP